MAIRHRKKTFAVKKQRRLRRLDHLLTTVNFMSVLCILLCAIFQLKYTLPLLSVLSMQNVYLKQKPVLKQKL